MNLFKLNKDLALKLNQSFDTLYNLEYMEYSLLLNIVNEETEKKNNPDDLFTGLLNNNQPMRVNLPDNLKFK
ncbi:hypothetical protein UFOVP1247_325 [uncultured Caudovirales phage]|jgi:hypothetical protein|uniref:Uncharacterized protein n=1 Tax=uncultured Caudovirales phage TaxID=2100421 RepID=A0A6J5RQ68_9CAUD|nr:hypothetical protein UFOVP970_12 [uncultured Caudovirales phage]CAB4193954.1 hypothetical protein UFOVP1247_325 [uncultured Caudovirales phage]